MRRERCPSVSSNSRHICTTLKALCHCLDCRKITGSAFSTNIIVDAEGFKVTKGTPKTFAKTADSGKTVTSYFCGDCGTTLWRETETYGNTKIIKAGTLDDDDVALDNAKPVVELFVKHRVSWVPTVSGTEEKQAA